MAEAQEGAKSVTCNKCSKAKYPQLQAAKQGHVKCLMSSLERAGLVDKKGRFEAMDVDEFGATALHHCCRHDQVQCLSVIVKLAHVKECVRAKNGATALHDAAATGSVRCLNYLLKHTQHSLVAADKTGSTPLHWAVQAKQEESVVALLQANGITCTSLTKLGVTPLHVASAKNNLAILKLLVNYCLSHGEEAVINMQAKSGATPAYFAAQEGYTECLRYLVLVGQADLTLRAKDKMMCIHAAAQHGHVECLNWILQCYGAQHANDRGPDNATIAHFAASQGNKECLEWILTETVLTGKERDQFGATPLHDAADNNHLECVKCLLSHEVLAVATDNDDNTPLSLATAAGHTEIVKCIQDHLEQLKEKDKEKRLADLRTKQQEEQDRKLRVKLEKQRKKEQEKLQKMQAKLKQEEEKQKQREQKRQQLEAKLAAEAGLEPADVPDGEAAAAKDPQDAMNDITLPANHEDWSKLEDEAHAQALEAGVDRSGDPQDGSEDDKLNVSGTVSFRLSEDGSTRKKEKKEKPKTLRGLGRWIKRTSSEKDGLAQDRKGVSRRSSQSSASTENRSSKPGSQSSLATPGSSRAEMRSTADTEDDEEVETGPRPRGYVKKRKKQYESKIKDRQSHFSRFFQRGDSSKKPEKERPSSGKKERPRSAGKKRPETTSSGEHVSASMVSTDGVDTVDGAVGVPGELTGPSRKAAEPQTRSKSRFSLGLTNIASFLSRGNRQSTSQQVSSTATTRPPLASTDSLLNEGALEFMESPSSEPGQNLNEPLENGSPVVAEAVMMVGDEDNDDSDDAVARTPTVGPRERRLSSIATDVSTGLARDTQKTWTPDSATSDDASAANIQLPQSDPSEPLPTSPQDEMSPAEASLRQALQSRQTSLAAAILLNPSANESDPAMPALPRSASIQSEENETKAGGLAMSGAPAVVGGPSKPSLESALFGGSSAPKERFSRERHEPMVELRPSRAKSLEHLSQAGRDSNKLFDDLKTGLFAEDESIDAEQTGRGGLEAALRGASSMEYIASQREAKSPMTSQSDHGLEAALFSASSIEHMASHRESMEHISVKSQEAPLKQSSSNPEKAARSLDHILHAAENDVAGQRDSGIADSPHSRESAEATQVSGDGAFDLPQTHRLTAVSAHVGDDMLPLSRTSTSLTPSTGTLDTIEEGENEPSEPSDKEQSPEDKYYRHQLVPLQQRSTPPAEECSRLSSRSNSLPTLVESAVEHG